MQRRKKRNDDDFTANNTNSSTTKKLTTKDPLNNGSNEEQEGTHSRKYNKNTEKVSSVSPNMDDYNSNPYGSQGSTKKNAKFNPSNDPNKSKNIFQLNVAENDIKKDKNTI